MNWGHMLKQFCDGTSMQEDFNIINRRVIRVHLNKTESQQELPRQLLYVTRLNKEHDSINAGVFNKALKHDVNSTFIILSDWLGAWKCLKEKCKAIHNPTVFWKKCGEANCKFPSKSTARIDPPLKLFQTVQLCSQKH